MRNRLALPCLAALALTTSVAHADPTLRVQVSQHGDFLLIGNTLGYDCDSGTPAPVVGTLAADACQQAASNVNDSSPDVYWSADDPALGQVTADTATLASAARSTAVLTVPAGATVTHAYLYWAAVNTSNVAGAQVTLERPGASGFAPQTIAAQDSWLAGSNNAYQSFADITATVQQNGSGAYRVSGIDVAPFVNADVDVLFGGWWIVVFYQLPSDPVRNLAVFDGLDVVKSGANVSATLSGFVVPNAGFAGKLGVAAWEGDNQATGDSLYFNGAQLSDALNPANNFFNSTRSWLGKPVSVAGDLPQLTGGAQSTAGVDLDVVDITPQLTQGQTSAPIKATTVGDTYFLGGFVTSISTFSPDLSSSTKTALDVNGGVLVPGDVLRYTITANNDGNDAAVQTLVTDPLPTGVTYVAGSLTIDGVTKTDAAGDDQAEYTAATRTVTARLGTGANGTAGGTLAVGASSVVTFDVKVNAGVTGSISNQGTLQAAGMLGAPLTTWVTDGNGGAAGSPPTVVLVGQCASSAMCTAPTPVCDVATGVCVGCLSDGDCGSATSGEVCGPSSTCIAGCRGTGGNGCPQGQTCSSTSNAIGTCSGGGTGGSTSTSTSTSGASTSTSTSGASTSTSTGSSSGAGGAGGAASSTSSSGGAGGAKGTGGASTGAGNGGAGAGHGVGPNQEGSCKCSLEPRDDRFGWSLGAALALIVAGRRRRSR
jgi:uncharacterized repeat protein (TIGR01451 family)